MDAPSSNQARLLSPEAVTRIHAWLQGEAGRPPASINWLAGQCDVSGTHMQFVLRRGRECSPRLAGAISVITGIPTDELLPLAGVA